MGLNRFARSAFCLAFAIAASGCATTDTGQASAPGRSGTGTPTQAAASKGTDAVATSAVAGAEDPSAWRAPAQVMRIWIAPWEDSRGDLHAPGYLYTEIVPRRWRIGAPAEPQPVALIRPLQIEQRDTRPRATRADRDTGTPRTPGRVNAPAAGPSLLGS
ncbi:TraV family lipoprotein [Thiococcus pfennigii]|uniref:TraV family lipoprotein n=1 Tax=Thiococcus pfennigii TaxID=1057 RepID=UPI0019069377|nr:TraV family lipoprotein [Thiococcus pfennigii]MBK1700210.1 hypothetical protein [Thiococcus pfennigii]